MSSDWATSERELIKKAMLNNTGKPGPPSPFQEYSISLLTQVTQSSLPRNVTEEIAHKILTSPQAPEVEWDAFCSLIFGAAMFTSEASVHERLVALVFMLANHRASNTGNPDRDGPDVSSEKEETIAKLLSNLHAFDWIARDLWNGISPLPKPAQQLTNPFQGPQILYPHPYPTPEAAQLAWANLNRFTAHLSVQQRLSPVEPLQNWLEDFGLWTITEGLEYRRHPEYVEAACVWFPIAGPDIKNDLKWGRRDEGLEVHRNPLYRGPLWKNKLEQGAGPETRWDFWKERLGEIVRDEKFDALTRERAGDAERAITWL
jgi:hypothetical protein